MKKVVSLLLVLVMICSLGAVSIFATTDYTNGTAVVYDATADNDDDGNPDATEAWTVTVPATMAPGETAEVHAEGTWASNRKLTVTADLSVTLTNSINANDTKVLDVTFAGIELTGSNTEAVEATEELSIEDIADALFGTWTGHIDYEVEMSDVK